MKEAELRKHTTCDQCHKPICHTGLPLFWVVKAERFGIKLDAVRRQDGLGQFFGSSMLASVMGADEDMTQTLAEFQFTLCDTCATMGPVQLGGIWEAKEREDCEREEAAGAERSE